MTIRMCQQGLSSLIALNFVVIVGIILYLMKQVKISACFAALNILCKRFINPAFWLHVCRNVASSSRFVSIARLFQ